MKFETFPLTALAPVSVEHVFIKIFKNFPLASLAAMYVMGSQISHDFVENSVQMVGLCFKLFLENIEIRNFSARSTGGNVQHMFTKKLKIFPIIYIMGSQISYDFYKYKIVSKW